jgi:hypothetical protein
VCLAHFKTVRDLTQLDEVCGEILALLNDHLIPSASSVEASVFYLKVTGMNFLSWAE